VKYKYDDLHRLIVATITETATGQVVTERYKYNAIGNILSKSDAGDYEYANTGYATPQAATKIGGSVISYDNNGNMTSDSVAGLALTWDYRNRLSESVAGESEASYIYDANNQRVSQTVGENVTIYPNKYFEDRNGEGFKRIYLGSELLVSIDANSSKHFTYTDHLSGSNVVTDARGAVEQVLDYKPFGEVRVNQQNAEYDETKKFTGYESDSSGLSYAGARYYNPRYGKFVSQDAWDGNIADPQSLNKYSYSRNNPLRYVDPSGNIFFEWLLAKTIADTFFSDQTPQEAVETGAGFVPVVGEWVDAYETIVGEEVFTGNELSNTDRVITGVATVVPYVGGAVVRKVVNGVSDVLKDSKNIWSSTNTKTSVENALDHWNTHKNEFKELDNAKQYVDKARNFFEEKSDDILEYSRKNGELIKYNKITKEFGAFLEDGTPKTLFKPENGIEYWYKQIINW